MPELWAALFTPRLAQTVTLTRPGRCCHQHGIEERNYASLGHDTKQTEADKEHNYASLGHGTK